MKEVGAEEFLHLLKTIYPPPNDADVNPNNVGACCIWLIDIRSKLSLIDARNTSKSVPLAKFPWDRSFCTHEIIHLSELLEHCIKECKTVDVVKKLRATKYYSLLDKDIKLRILDNIT
uniref:Uncharacterized protein n=1 Tax=Ditylenchus dipsaci TaxID=166011 RepID=A0A915CP05_9BILA